MVKYDNREEGSMTFAFGRGAECWVTPLSSWTSNRRSADWDEGGCGKRPGARPEEDVLEGRLGTPLEYAGGS